MVKKPKKVFWKPATDEGTGYLVLDGRTEIVSGIVKRTETLSAAETKRKDLMVNLDFDAEDRLIGIEIVNYD